jgi:2-polyprenyl-3-methyl-5-hydroxy-6-metoxy-1,4-benzoquinol methylase
MTLQRGARGVGVGHFFGKSFWKNRFEPRCVDYKKIKRSRILGKNHARYGPSELLRQKLHDELASYHFYHMIEIIPGVITKGWAGSEAYVQEVLSVMRSYDLRGRSVLDVGARDGVLSIMAERFGATRIVAVDNDFSEGLCNFCAPFLLSNIECIEANVYDLSEAVKGNFDFVVSAGLLYHLHLPFLGLKRLRDKLRTGGTLILETAILNEFDDLPLLLFFNLEGLQGALEALGFANVCVQRTFAEGKHSANEQFPKFVRRHPAYENLSLMRAVVTAQRIERTGILYDYWEGLHAFHSADGPDPGLVSRPRPE